MTPETGRLGIKKERRDGRGGGGEDRTARRARQMTSFWWQSLKTEESQRTCLRAITKPSGRTPCSHGLNPELITGSLDSKHGVNYQSQMSNDYQREVKNKPACLIRLTSTSLNLHANSQLSMHTFKIKAIVWLALQIILISSELEGNISNPIILQIRKLNKVKTDKVAYPSSQSHFGMKKWFSSWFLVLYHVAYRVRKKWTTGDGARLYWSYIRGEKMGRAGHLSPGNKAPGCSQALRLPLFSAYTLQQRTVLPTPPLGFFPQTFQFDVAKGDAQ